MPHNLSLHLRNSSLSLCTSWRPKLCSGDEVECVHHFQLSFPTMCCTFPAPASVAANVCAFAHVIMCFLLLLNHSQSRSCNFSWDRKWSNKLARVRLQKIHSATNLFCHCFVLLSGRPRGNRWTQGWLVCDSGLSVGWGELNLQLRRAKSFSLWRELCVSASETIWPASGISLWI